MAQHKVIGILGGMGPLATADLFHKIIELTKAAVDQAHLPIVVANIPQIPDRTAALLRGGEDPTPHLLASAERLKHAGADFMIVPCNNSHYFLKQIHDSLPLPLLSMIDTTADVLHKQGVKAAGIMATSGTLQSHIYDDALQARAIEAILPTDAEQKIIMEVIYDVVKAGHFDYDPAPFVAVIAALRARGAEILILGCTELPIAITMFELDGHFIDPTLEIAKAAILEAGGELNHS